MRSRSRSGLLALTVGAGFLLAACGGTTSSSTSSSSPSSAPASSSAPVVKTASISVGGASEMVLTTTGGMTLYYFTSDSASSIACSGGCASVWPPLTASDSNPTSASSLPGKLSAIKGANGMQVEYNGHPLYTYSKDTNPGDAKGQGLFGKWFVATPSIASVGGASASPSKAGYNPY